MADKGYHSRAGLKAMEDGPWKSRAAKPRRDAFLRWHGDDAVRTIQTDMSDQVLANTDKSTATSPANPTRNS